MAELGLRDGIEILKSRARIAKMACYLVMITGALVMIAELLQWSGTVDLERAEMTPADALAVFSYLGWVLFFIGSVIVVGMWIYRAQSNLVAAGFDLEISPGWAVGWFFVPLANFVMPFRAMKQLMMRSEGYEDLGEVDTTNLLVPWWGTWLGGNILNSISERLPQLESAFVIAAIGSAALVISAFLLMRIITTVTSMQVEKLEIGTAFA